MTGGNSEDPDYAFSKKDNLFLLVYLIANVSGKLICKSISKSICKTQGQRSYKYQRLFQVICHLCLEYKQPFFFFFNKKKWHEQFNSFGIVCQKMDAIQNWMFWGFELHLLRPSKISPSLFNLFMNRWSFS